MVGWGWWVRVGVLGLAGWGCRVVVGGWGLGVGELGLVSWGW